MSNDEQKRAWRDARRDYIYEKAGKKVSTRILVWRLFWAAVFLRVAAEFFKVEIYPD